MKRADDLRALFLDPSFTPQTVFEWLLEGHELDIPEISVDTQRLSVKSAQTIIERLVY